MPYIKLSNRNKWGGVVEIRFRDILEKEGITPGELNYLITKLCHYYVEHKGKNYTHLNDVVGVLECAKQEFYRKIVTPYEEEKIEENGDL